MSSPVTIDSFPVADIGGCLFLKLCGFVEAQQAEIRDVSETHLRLRIGSTLGAWMSRSTYPVELEIFFHPLESNSPNPQSQVDVVFRDIRWFRSSERFVESVRRILWQLKYHLMACA